MTEQEICAVGRAGLIAESDPGLRVTLEERRRTGRCRALLLARRKDGSSFLGEFASSVFRNEHGEEMTITMFGDVTERKRAEESLRANEEQLRVALGAGRMGTWLLDVATGMVTTDALHRQLFDIEDDQPLVPAQVILSRIHPEDAHKTFSPEQLAQISGPLDLEFRVCRRNGEVRWLRGAAIPLQDSNGLVNRVVGVNFDVTERKRTEDALRQSEQSFRRMADHAPVMLWVTTPDGSCSYLSQSWYEFTGQTLETGLGVNWIEAVHPEDRTAVEKAFRQANATREPLRLEYRLRSKDGAHSWVMDYARPWLGQNGEFLGYIGSVIDITERKQAEEIVAAQGRFRQALLDTLPAHIAVLDEQGCVVAVNESWRRFARENGGGAEEKFAKGANYLEACRKAVQAGDEYAAQVLEGLQRVLAGNVVQYRCEYPCHAPWQKRWFTLKVLRAPELGGVVVIHTDITERMEAEESIKEERARFQHLFENAPVALWLEDWTALRQWLLRLRQEGVEDLRAFLREKPAQVWQALGLMKILDVNQAAVQQNGARDKAELLAKRTQLFTEKTYECFIGQLEAIWKGQCHFEYESVSQRLDGKRLDLIICVDVPRNKEGGELDFSRVIVTGTDITERKKAESIRAELSAIVESSQDGIISRDLEGNVRSWNAGAERLYGYTETEMIGANVAQLVPAGKEQEAEAIVDRVKRGERVSHFETIRLRKDGRLVEVSVALSPIKDNTGRVVGMSGIARDISERKRAEAALQAEQAIQKAVIESIPGAFYVLDDQGRFFRWNAFTRDEMVGKAEAEVARTHALEVIHPEDRELIQQKIVSVLQAGREEEVEGRILLRGGPASRHFLFNGRPVLVNDRAYLVGIGVDITERKRSERLMRARLKLMQYAAEHSLPQVLQATVDEAEALTGSQIGFLHFVEADQERLRMQAWSTRTQKEFCNVGTFERHYPLSQAGVWVDCVRERRPVIHNDISVLRHRKGLPTGHAPVVRELVVPVFRNELIVAVLGVGNKAEDYTSEDVENVSRLADLAWDIAARKQAEEQIHKLSYAVDQGSASILITDQAGTVEYVNRKHAELTGYSREEVLGQDLKALLGDKCSEGECQQLWQTITQGREWHGELQTRKKSGEMYLEAVSISPVLDGVGQIAHFLMVGEDITEKRRLEEKLRQVQKMEAVGQLAGGVAHDFNNILAAMMLQLEFLRQGEHLGPEVRQDLDELLAGARRAATLTAQLLMFGRRSMLDMRELDLNALVENLLKMLRRVIGEQIALAFDGESGLPTVKADAGRIEQVLMNLTVNARDAMPQGGLITITTREVEISDQQARANLNAQAGRFVCMAVSDTGCGMDEAILKHLFEPFFTTKGVGKGTGLGLATVHGIVGQHKGWVEVESRPGKGTVFRFFLPALSRRTQVPEKPKAIPMDALRGTETILLVEDEEVVRRTAGRLLRLLGYQVLEAGNGREAIAIWEKDRASIALLLTDMRMPGGVTGHDLARKLQADKPGLKVIISSGYSEQTAQHGQAPKSGISYLPKPYDAIVLGTLLRKCLAGREGLQ